MGTLPCVFHKSALSDLGCADSGPHSGECQAAWFADRTRPRRNNLGANLKRHETTAARNVSADRVTASLAVLQSPVKLAARGPESTVQLHDFPEAAPLRLRRSLVHA